MSIGKSLTADGRASVLGLMLGAFFLAGCAAAKGPSDPRLARLGKETGEVAMQEQQCVERARAKAADALAQITSAPDALADPNSGTVKSNYYWDIWQCHAEASRAKEEISGREREEYDIAQKQERDRAALMATLLVSRPH